MSIRSVAYGEILWDIIEGEPFLGGAPFNFASHLAQFGAGSSIISRLGNDDLGEKALVKARQYGVGTHYIQRDTLRPTGTVEVVLSNRQPDYTIFDNVAYDHIDYPVLSGKTDVFYFGSLIQRNVTSSNTLKSLLENHTFPHIFYDVNLRKECYSKAIISGSLEKCTILKLNIEEVPVISRLLFDQLLDNRKFAERITAAYEIAIVIITAGDKGCFVFHNGTLTAVEGVNRIVRWRRRGRCVQRFVHLQLSEWKRCHRVRPCRQPCWGVRCQQERTDTGVLPGDYRSGWKCNHRKGGKTLSSAKKFLIAHLLILRRSPYGPVGQKWID